MPAVSWVWIKEETTFLNFVAKFFDIIFGSKFNKETGNHLQINVLFLFDFSNSLIMTYFSEVPRCFHLLTFWCGVHKWLLSLIPEGIIKFFCNAIASRLIVVLKTLYRVKTFFFPLKRLPNFFLFFSFFCFFVVVFLIWQFRGF